MFIETSPIDEIIFDDLYLSGFEISTLIIGNIDVFSSFYTDVCFQFLNILKIQIELFIIRNDNIDRLSEVSLDFQYKIEDSISVGFSSFISIICDVYNLGIEMPNELLHSSDNKIR